MRPSSGSRKYLILFILMIGPGLVLLFLSRGNHNFQYLPFYGQKEVVFLETNGEKVADTLYHRIPDFSFVNQDSQVVSQDNFEQKILVVDFFFTTCPSICPIMTRQMERLQWLLDDSAYEDVVLLSHTVDPEHDTPAVLKKYAKDHNADLNRWVFLTGEKKEIYEQGVNGYLLPAQEDALAPGGFLHSEQFVLVDKNRHIRGFYDGTRSEEVDKLVTDIKMLLKEEKLEAKEKAKNA